MWSHLKLSYIFHFRHQGIQPYEADDHEEIKEHASNKPHIDQL